MKINTITCHDVYNVGAGLQAYALASYLTGLGHDVHIIDYKPEYLSHHYSLTAVNNPKYNKPFLRALYLMLKLPGRVKALYSKRKAAFDSFRQDFLPLTSARYSTNEQMKAVLPHADIYFAGSDQIWNTSFPNGKDPAFYLDFAPLDAVKASYAASFATEDIPEEWKPQVKEWLDRLDAISVRENSGIDIIQGLGIDGATQVLDPVFLLNMAAWEKLEAPIKTEHPYVLLYDFDKNAELVQAAKKLAKNKGWKLYSILPCEECDKCFAEEGPLGFLSLIHHASFVISNSFHATAFSLIFHKDFVVVNRKEAINTRMRDLLCMVDLEERNVRNYDFEGLPAIDYRAVDCRLENATACSKAFIDKVIAMAEQ